MAMVDSRADQSNKLLLLMMLQATPPDRARCRARLRDRGASCSGPGACQMPPSEAVRSSVAPGRFCRFRRALRWVLSDQDQCIVNYLSEQPEVDKVAKERMVENPVADEIGAFVEMVLRRTR